MAFCTACGAPLTETAAFCPNCGAAVKRDHAAAGTSEGSAEPGPAGSTPGGYPSASTTPAISQNLAGMLCYIFFAAVIFLLVEPYNRNRFIRFHAFQSIFLNLAWIAVFIVLSIIGIVLLPIPFLGPMLSIILHLGVSLGAFILWLMLMYKAYNRERWVLPIIGPLAEKQA